MKRSPMMTMAAALAAGGFFGSRRSIAAGINHHTPRDGSRLAAAELKRARKNAKRVGLVTLPASDATTTVELPK